MSDDEDADGPEDAESEGTDEPEGAEPEGTDEPEGAEPEADVESETTEPDPTAEPSESEAATTAGSDGEGPAETATDGSGPRYDRAKIAGSAFAALLVASFLVTWAAGSAVFHEELFRSAPTVADGGIGADWAAGNTIPALDFLVALVHAADVILGAFILFLLFVHWAAFRRIADRMHRPGRAEAEEVAADGGRADGGDPE